MAIVWLASYPKSGNTWLRAFLTNYLLHDDAPASINGLVGRLIASDRTLFDDHVGLDSADMTQAEVDLYRPLYLRQLVAENEGTIYAKVHDTAPSHRFITHFHA